MLKSLLSLLLSKFYSKKENEAVGHQAMPGASTTTLLSNTTVTDWETVATGVAADDGYLVLDAKNSGNEGASLALSIGGVTRTSLLYPFIGAGGNAFAPIAKGDAWAIVGSSSENIRLRLFKTIGGGDEALKNALLPGGVICLKHLCNPFRRTFLLARSLGFTKTLSLLRTTLSRCSQVLREFQNGTTQRLLTVWLLSLLEKHQPRISPVSLTSTALEDNSSKTLNKAGKLIPLFTSLRATFFTWQREATIQRSVSSCSIPRLNSVVGGASC